MSDIDNIDVNIENKENDLFNSIKQVIKIYKSDNNHHFIVQ